jgi:broad specificity phosphatase PhoE
VRDARPETRLLWVRHAQARGERGIGPETPLSELGRRQAQALADAMRESTRADVLYTSPFRRAVETAATLARALDLEPIEDVRLAEFTLGIEDAMSMAEVAEQRPDLQVWRSEHGPPGGETLGEFTARVASFCEDVVRRHAGGTLLVVAHAGTIDAALRWTVGLPAESPWQHEFELRNASITEVHCWPDGRVPGGAPRYATILRACDDAHLGADLASEG